MLQYKIRQMREVTILDLSGRISVGEALASAREVALCSAM